MPKPPTGLPPRATLSSLLDDRDAIISDVWGVVHNGERATASACDALVRARRAGKAVVLLSNAPRPHGSVIHQLDGLSVPREAYDAVVTSGDLTRAMLEADPWAWVHHVGPPRDAPLFEGLDLTFSAPDEADVCVVSGLLDDETEQASDYDPLLATLLEHDVPMACANPDLVVERGERLIPCAGAIADRYAGMGGVVTYYGKPHGIAYEAALAKLSAVLGRAVDTRRVLAIGDAVRTDMIGARDAGIDGLFLAAGIHAKALGGPDAIDEAALLALFREGRVAPAAWAWTLAW
jgi:HAD superfamily hydrolase (TIGR01459 family)